MKENILFLEQWINYHSLLGFNEFYLYDNSKVRISNKGCHHKHACFKAGKVNKYNIDYDTLVNLTDIEIKEHVNKIINKYSNVHIIEWSPKNREGIIIHDQLVGHNHCFNNYLKKNNIDWCANIDMDEYIVIKDYNNVKDYILSLPSNVSSVSMGQVRFKSRFKELNKLVTDITDSEVELVPRDHGNKPLYNIENSLKLDTHNAFNKNNFKTIYPDVSDICINHYKLDKYEVKEHILKSIEYKEVKNIHQDIKKKINKDLLIPIKGISYE
jgi:hypothetical protein